MTLISETINGTKKLPEYLSDAFRDNNGNIYELNFSNLTLRVDTDKKTIYGHASITKSQPSTRSINPNIPLLGRLNGKPYNKRLWNFSTDRYSNGEINHFEVLVTEISNGKYKEVIQRHARFNDVNIERGVLNKVFKNLDDQVREFLT
ncbi:MAG: hypothetical protein ABIH25_03015 [Candidatus Woesearchaeota archaeon]